MNEVKENKVKATFSLSGDVLTELKQYSKKSLIPMSSLIEDLVKKHLEKEKGNK